MIPTRARSLDNDDDYDDGNCTDFGFLSTGLSPVGDSLDGSLNSVFSAVLFFFFFFFTRSVGSCRLFVVCLSFTRRRQKEIKEIWYDRR